MKTFHCDHCNHLVFFENERCERCEARLGYVLDEMHAFEEAGEGRWRIVHGPEQGEGTLFRQCHNYAIENVCNGMIPADCTDTLCRACQFTRTIPNLTRPENRLYWYRLETAKRRVLYTLDALGLPLVTRAEDPEHGLQFEFLEETGDGRPIMTGHDHGIVTMNIAEADDAHRERTRVSLHEPYRTLLGHFRHEVGHYYFDRLIAQEPTRRWLEPFRLRFGDERTDYAAALAAHYAEGPAPDWAERHVSAYASVHPWEDWAETWAHYLHIVDTLDTATACGLALLPESPDEPMLVDQTPVDEASFESLMERWFPLTYVLNSLNRSLGMPDGYPFALATPVIDKLRFVHRVISASSVRS